MPLYEYRCTKCGHAMEVLQKISDRPLRRCPECAGKLEKLISRTSFQLKGGGWFAHGYGNGSSSKSGKSTSSGGGTSDSSAAGTKKDDSKGSSAASAASA